MEKEKKHKKHPGRCTEWIAPDVKQSCFDYAQAVLVLLKWLAIGILTGVLVGTVGALFGNILTAANRLRQQFPLLALGLPFGGLLIVFLYRYFKNADDKGTNTIVSSLQESTDIPLRMAPLIFASTSITQLFGGSSGREGAAIQMGGSIGKALGVALRFSEGDQKAVVMCGMSAGFSALFGTPMAAAVFSLEVVSVGIMQYSALVPCVTASLTAYYVAGLCGMKAETFPVQALPAMTPESFLQVLSFGALAAAVSILFCLVLHKGEHLYEKLLKNQYLRIFVGGVLILVLAAVLGTDGYLGSGMDIIEEIFHTGKTPWYTFLLKILFTVLTLGAGFKGGEIVPSFCIGAALGCAAAPLFGLPPQLLAACGMIGVFCGVTNSPVTSLLIAFELFGYEAMPYYLTAVAVSYLLSGYHTLYKRQQIVYSKTHSSFKAYLTKE